LSLQNHGALRSKNAAVGSHFFNAPRSQSQGNYKVGNRYQIGAREILDGRPSLPGPIGPVLAARGYAVLCLDMPCFGDRAGLLEGPASKAALWQGRSLAGQMLGENAAALTWAIWGLNAGRPGF
jgi:hypothetical protein